MSKTNGTPVIPTELPALCAKCAESQNHVSPCKTVADILLTGGLAGTQLCDIAQLPCFESVLCAKICGARNKVGECQAMNALTTPYNAPGFVLIDAQTALVRMPKGCQGEI